MTDPRDADEPLEPSPWGKSWKQLDEEREVQFEEYHKVGENGFSKSDFFYDPLR